MPVIQKGFNPNICAEISQIQEDLEIICHKIFDKAGSNIKLEEKTEYIHELEETKQAIERFKYKFC